jgi:hypothetical protein
LDLVDYFPAGLAPVGCFLVDWALDCFPVE